MKENKMFAYLNVTKFIFYGTLVYAAWIGDIPWWVVPAWVAYDNSFYILAKIPFTKAKAKFQNKPFNWADYKGPTNTPGNDNNLGAH